MQAFSYLNWYRTKPPSPFSHILSGGCEPRGDKTDSCHSPSLYHLLAGKSPGWPVMGAEQAETGTPSLTFSPPSIPPFTQWLPPPFTLHSTWMQLETLAGQSPSPLPRQPLSSYDQSADRRVRISP